MRPCIAVLLAALLASCTVLPEREPVNLYQLPAPTVTATDAAIDVGGLRIARPGTSDALGASRMLVMRDDNRFETFPEARWAAPIPLLWRDWLLDAFWRDGRFTDVSSDQERLAAQVELSGVLRGLHAEFLNGSMEVVIRYDARLIRIQGREIIASQRFEAREPAAGTSADASVAALGRAADRLVAELLDWAAEQSAGR